MIDKIVRIDHSTGSLLNVKFCGVNCPLHVVKLKYGYLRSIVVQKNHRVFKHWKLAIDHIRLLGIGLELAWNGG